MTTHNILTSLIKFCPLENPDKGGYKTAMLNCVQLRVVHTSSLLGSSEHIHQYREPLQQWQQGFETLPTLPPECVTYCGYFRSDALHSLSVNKATVINIT